MHSRVHPAQHTHTHTHTHTRAGCSAELHSQESIQLISLTHTHVLMAHRMFRVAQSRVHPAHLSHTHTHTHTRTYTCADCTVKSPSNLSHAHTHTHTHTRADGPQDAQSFTVESIQLISHTRVLTPHRMLSRAAQSEASPHQDQLKGAFGETASPQKLLRDLSVQPF